jgi:hypothetical protein
MFRFRCSRNQPTAADLQALRKWVSLGIAEIRRRAAANEALFEVSALEGDWHSNRIRLRELYTGIKNNSLPLMVSEARGNVDETLSLEKFYNRLRHLRQIELETQMHTQLELGEIGDRSEFQPYDEDWAPAR